MRIVIDADVARAAGITDHPRSSRCRALLDTIARKKHVFAASQQLRAEWHEHQSAYSAKWLANMVARKLVDFVGPVDCSEVEAAIRLALQDPGLRDAAIKDSHLVAGALQAERVLASMDTAARENFVVVAATMGRIRKLVWLNPECDSRDWLSWLANDSRITRSDWLVP